MFKSQPQWRIERVWKDACCLLGYNLHWIMWFILTGKRVSPSALHLAPVTAVYSLKTRQFEGNKRETPRVSESAICFNLLKIHLQISPCYQLTPRSQRAKVKLEINSVFIYGTYEFKLPRSVCVWVVTRNSTTLFVLITNIFICGNY